MLFDVVVAADSVSVVVIRESATLTCSVTGLDDVSGTIVWMKDHNYFPTQEHSRTIPLTSDGYKLLTNDLSNRLVLITHSLVTLLFFQNKKEAGFQG